MAGDLRDLAKRMNKYADRLPENVNEVKKKVVRTVVNDLAHITPVDTSQAISNWQTNIGSAPQGELPPHYPGEGGSSYQASARETIDRAEKELAIVKPGQAVYLSNVLPYIKPLNDGSSRQAPAGFVERAILLGRKIASSAKLFK